LKDPTAVDFSPEYARMMRSKYCVQTKGNLNNDGFRNYVLAGHRAELLDGTLSVERSEACARPQECASAVAGADCS
jgi:hypothetical protein